jgi:CHAT domain-containing protein
LDAIVAWFDKHRCRAIRLDDSRPDCAPASKAALLDLLPRADLFHIACHGIFKADAPDQSGLLLIPQPDEVEMLTLRELSALNLTRMRHATLSSCWSADHFILPGRWVISLPETLWRAGAQSVLGCLWVVNDDLASDFMRQFHAYLEEHPRDEALRRAQLDFLHDKDRAASYYWAGYNLYGDHSRFIV